MTLLHLKKLPRLVVIAGPTGSGKTKLARALCLKFNGEIVSADSRQLYRGAVIGTNYEDTAPVPQHLVQRYSPRTRVTVAQYKKAALKVIRGIVKRGHVPFLVGGTGHYIKAIIDNLEIPEVKPNARLRTKLGRLPIARLAALLRKKDPKTAAWIDLQNPRRIIRAIEVFAATGKSFTQIRKKGPLLFNILLLYLDAPRKKLRARLLSRAKQMLNQGLLTEYRSLTRRYPSGGYLDAIPYQVAREYILCLHGVNKNTDRGFCSLVDVTDEIARRELSFAKRQLTWFRNDPRVIQDNNRTTIASRVRHFLDEDDTA